MICIFIFPGAVQQQYFWTHRITSLDDSDYIFTVLSHPWKGNTLYFYTYLISIYIYIYTLNIVLCLRHFLLLAARNHECGPVAKLSKKSGTKGDCISIAKKLKLLDEFHELKNSGVKNANQDMCFDQNDILLLSRFGSKRTDYSAFKNSWCTFCSRCVCVYICM